MKIFAPLLIAHLSSLPAHGALSSEEQKCVRAHHRALLKVAASQDAELRKCHSRAASAKLDGSIQACLAASEKVGRALE